MAWGPNSQFLVICDCSGTIHFFSFGLGDVVFTSTLVDIPKKNMKSSYFSYCMFARSKETGASVTLAILSHDGSVFSFKDLPLCQLSSALELKDFASISQLKENIQMEILNVRDLHNDTCCCVESCIDIKAPLVISGTGQIAVSLWAEKSLVDVIDATFLDGASVRMCDVSLDGKYLLLLDEHSRLSVWDMNALVMLSVPCHAVKEFILTSSSAAIEDGTIVTDAGQVVTLTENNEGQSKIKIYQLPNFKEVYSKDVAEGCSLAKSNLQEKMYYIENYVNRVSNEKDQGLTFKCLSEASPEHRVYSLIRKKRFDAALEFSRAFRLDEEFVYKAKASTILANISTKISESDVKSQDKSLSVDQLIDELEETLQNVRSIEFTVECCLTASPPQLQQVHRLLTFAKNKIGRLSNKDTNKYSKEMNQVLLSIHRLETFQIIFGNYEFSGNKWRPFSAGSMFKKVTQALSEGKLSIAAIIWVRHHTEFESDFSCDKLQTLLSSIRSDLPSSSIISWLKSYLIPYVLCSVRDQDALYVLASWLEQRVVSLEISEKDEWPGNGLDMATLLFDVVSKCSDVNNNYRDIPTPVLVSQNYGCAVVTVSAKDSEPNPISSLALLVEHLIELKKLHINYHAKLPLADFRMKTPTEIVFKMLDCVLTVTLIPTVIKNQITIYCAQHGFHIDDVILSYITQKTKQVHSSTSLNALYDERYVEITRCIKARAKRLEAILKIMSWASVPWSSTIEKMVSEAMHDDPSNPGLKFNYRLMEMKKIVRQYGIRDVQFSCNLHLKNVVKYMLSTSHKTALEDAFRIVESYQCMSELDVYVTRLRYLCLKSLHDEFARLLESVDNSKIISVCNYFLKWVLVVIDVYTEDEDDRNERNLVIQAGIQTLEYLQNIGKTPENVKSMLVSLKKILALQMEFSIFITYGDYNNVIASGDILSDYLKKSVIPLQTLMNTENRKAHDSDKLFRLGSLFGLSRVQLQYQIMLEHIFEQPKNLNAITMNNCYEWLQQNIQQLSCEDVVVLCKALLQQQACETECIMSSKDFNSSEMLYKFACLAATNGEVVSLDGYLELCKLCWLSQKLYIGCESGDLGLSTSVYEEDPLLLWNTASWFRDNGFVLDINAAFPLNIIYVKAVLLASKSPAAKDLEAIIIACQDLVLYLEENNLHELALHYAVSSLRHLVVFISLNERSCTEENGNLEQNHEMTRLHQFSVHGGERVFSMLLNLLSKVLHSSDVDHSIALGYLSSISEEAALKKLKSDFAVDEGHDAPQAIVAFDVLLNFARSVGDEHFVNAAEKLYSDALWHDKLQQLNIACKNLLIGEAKEVGKVLELLLEKPGVDVKDIIEFCKFFSIDVNATLHTYVKSNLTRRKPSKTGDPSVLSDLSQSSNNIDQFQDNLVCALEYMSSQSSDSELLALMKDVLLAVSMYDYERLLIVLDEIRKLSPNEEKDSYRRKMEVLSILTSYTRISTPSEYEEHFQVKELTFGIKEDSVVPKILSEKRLPFHPLFYGKPWKIIAPELNDETITKLLRVCQILKMQEDKVYCAAANNLVLPCLSENNAERGFSSNPSASIYFEKAADLLSVKNSEVTIKTRFTQLTRWPQCEERMKAANTLVESVLQWKSHCEGEELQLAERILKTLKDFSQDIAIQHILHSNGVTDEQSHNLKRKPLKLISHLYETYGCLPQDKRPNVHKIADEVAVASDLNIAKVRSRLLSEWQPSSSSHGMRSPENPTAEDQNNVKRIMYIMQADSLQKNALFLLNYAYSKRPSKITYENRVSAMKLLFNVASKKVIESVANTSMDELKDYMKSLIYLSELEHLNLNQTIESFQRCNKEGLVKGLWKNHKDNARAILLIADICLDTKIPDPQIWTNILRQLSHLGLTSYLSNLLPRLVQFPNLWQASNLMKVWTDLAIQSLQKAVHPLSFEERTLCQKSLQLLQKCPIMTEAITPSVFYKLLELGMHSYALACLTVLPRKMLSTNLTKLMSVTTPKEILDLICEEQMLGQCFVNPEITQALIFDYLDASSSYKSLQNSEHYFKLADYLITNKNFLGMIMAMLKGGELNAAIELARYYDMYGSPVKTKSFNFDSKPSVAGLDDLVAVLKKSGVLEDAIPYLPDFEKKTEPQLDSVDSSCSEDVEFIDVF